MQDKGSINGRIIDKQNKPVEDAMVMISGNSPFHNDISAITNEKGEFNFRSLIPADYEITVNAEGFVIQRFRVHVEKGKYDIIDFILK